VRTDKRGFGLASGLFLLLAGVGVARGADAPSPATMAPREEYMIADRSDEIALARSAAPASIADDAGVLVLGARGYETAAQSANGFVCLVERAWESGFDHPDFWNPRVRGPLCMNPAAVRSVLPGTLERAQWALSGVSLAGMRERSRTSARANMAPAPGAMSFMLSKQGYLSGAHGHWHPHLMFFSPDKPGEWGADGAHSPVLSAPGAGRFTLFFVPLMEWSDGTPADMSGH